MTAKCCRDCCFARDVGRLSSLTKCINVGDGRSIWILGQGDYGSELIITNPDTFYCQAFQPRVKPSSGVTEGRKSILTQEKECEKCFDEEGSYRCIRPSHPDYRRMEREAIPPIMRKFI